MMKNELSEERCEIIISLADNNMNINKTARLLYMHRNTVEYHINRIKEITGKNPRNFYDLHRLVLMAKTERAERWIEANG